MQMIEISKLKSHPRNQEFFDDIPKERWDDFIKSIVRRGVVEAIVVTQDLLIVSGHQRVKACKEIGILEIPCRITHYPNEDEKLHIAKEDMILEDLICTNIMQRGVGNVNPMKMARCIRELERIYGVKKGGNGSNQYKNLNELNPNYSDEAKSQSDLAKQIGISQDTLLNYKKLNELIPELQSLVETGALKSTTAYKIWAKMPQDEQEKFFNDIGQEKIKQLTQKKTEQIISEKKQLEDKNKQLQEQLEKEISKEPEVITKTVEVDNTDYAQIEQLKKELQSTKSEKEKIEYRLNLMTEKAELYQKDSLEYEKMKSDIEFLTNKKDDLGRQIESITSISGLVVDIDHFIKQKLAPIKYSRALLEARNDDVVINNLSEIVTVVQGWCNEMKQYLPNEINYVEVL
ncbi:ParB N-terminal domain-containing protein [Clostridium botulinum C]|uniref:ParB/RepB/Spo0J family partition protein n=1 Tax=Clostridium botulinum TaxID=1491 RepID=UPI001E4F1624|nr:ParB/RepB/Spo0J family partition protein [Clostridium botulinum]MCD3245271.1 ParB N-terminal domain-containing protein [Clostridium botulinum C]MCD3261650.1 ParB N-terminal domain-containing protein [Clostridium botulinum C]